MLVTILLSGLIVWVLAMLSINSSPKKIRNALLVYEIYRKRDELIWFGREQYRKDIGLYESHLDGYFDPDAKYVVQFRTPTIFYIYPWGDSNAIGGMNSEHPNATFYENWLIGKMERWWYSNKHARSL